MPSEENSRNPVIQCLVGTNMRQESRSFEPLAARMNFSRVTMRDFDAVECPTNAGSASALMRSPAKIRRWCTGRKERYWQARFLESRPWRSSSEFVLCPASCQFKRIAAKVGKPRKQSLVHHAAKATGGSIVRLIYVAVNGGFISVSRQ